MSIIARALYQAPGLFVQPMVEFASPLYQLARTSLTPADAIRVSDQWIQLATRVALAAGYTFLKRKVCSLANAGIALVMNKYLPQFMNKHLPQWDMDEYLPLWEIEEPQEPGENASREEKWHFFNQSTKYRIQSTILSKITDALMSKYDSKVAPLSDYMIDLHGIITTILNRKQVLGKKIPSIIYQSLFTAFWIHRYYIPISSPGHLTGRIETLGSTFAPQLARLFGYQV